MCIESVLGKGSADIPIMNRIISDKNKWGTARLFFLFWNFFKGMVEGGTPFPKPL